MTTEDANLRMIKLQCNVLNSATERPCAPGHLDLRLAGDCRVVSGETGRLHVWTATVALPHPMISKLATQHTERPRSPGKAS